MTAPLELPTLELSCKTWHAEPIRTYSQIAAILRQRGIKANRKSVEWLHRSALKKLRVALANLKEEAL